MEKLSWEELKEIFIHCKPSQFKPPNWCAVEDIVSSKLGVLNDENLHHALGPFRKKFWVLKKKQNSVKSNKRNSDIDVLEDLLVLDKSQLNPVQEVEDEDGQSRPKYIKKDLTDLKSKKALLKRTDKIWEDLCKFASSEEVEVHRLLGLLLTRCDNKGASKIGSNLWEENEEKLNDGVSIDTAMAIMVDAGLGRQTYSNQRKILKSSGFNILPPWVWVRERQRIITPEVKTLSEDFVGVYFPFKESMKMTTQRILCKQTIFKDLTNGDKIKLQIKFGFDGSGSHAIYNQVNNEQTHNIIVTMFCPLSLEMENGRVFWVQDSPNNPPTHRPLQLQMGKESADSLRTLEQFNDEIKELKNEGVTIRKDDKELHLKVEIKSHMMDMKAAHLFLGLGGAYCDLCSYSRDACHSLDIIQNGFQIDRDVKTLHSIFQDLVQDDGSILKATGDYTTRAGLTTKPIPTDDCMSVQVLHALLRGFDHFMKLNVHLLACVDDWSETPTSLNKPFLHQAKNQIQTKLFEKCGERWDLPDQTGKGGTTTTGNTARKILHDSNNREVIIEMLPEKHREDIRRYGQQLSVIIRLISSSELVNVERYKHFCTGINMSLLRSFPWIRITPSLHKILAHSWELMDMNDAHGLKSLDESGLEGNNKILRKIRTKLARKTSQQDNLTDCLRRLWVSSDPVVNDIRENTKPFCKTCAVRGHSIRYCKKNTYIQPFGSDDALFESLLSKC